MEKTAQSEAAGISAWELGGVIWIAIAAFVSLYGPQPLLPGIRDAFGVSSQDASLLLTLALAPLGLAPLFYGALLGAASLHTLLRAAILCCVFSLIPPLFTDSFVVLLTARTVQGLCIPAIALCLMSHLAASVHPDFIQRAMSLYATGTMVGAYGGRIAAGCVGALWGWRAAFGLFAALMCLALFPALCLKGEKRPRFTPVDFGAVRDVLKAPGLLPLLLVGPACIFAHASVLNFLPFRMRTLDPSVSDAGIGLIYLTGLICAGAGVCSKILLRRLGSEEKVVRTGIFFFLGFTPLLLTGSLWTLGAAALGMGFGFALMYTTMPGLVNQRSPGGKNVTNSVYLTFYYCGSALGSWLLILLYSQWGPKTYAATLLAIFGLALTLLRKGRRRYC